MKGMKLFRMLAFVAAGGVLLETTGCSSSTLVSDLASIAVPLVLQLLLSGLAT